MLKTSATSFHNSNNLLRLPVELTLAEDLQLGITDPKQPMTVRSKRSDGKEFSGVHEHYAKMPLLAQGLLAMVGSHQSGTWLDAWISIA